MLFPCSQVPARLFRSRQLFLYISWLGGCKQTPRPLSCYGLVCLRGYTYCMSCQFFFCSSQSVLSLICSCCFSVQEYFRILSIKIVLFVVRLAYGSVHLVFRPKSFLLFPGVCPALTLCLLVHPRTSSQAALTVPQHNIFHSFGPLPRLRSKLSSELGAFSCLSQLSWF